MEHGSRSGQTIPLWPGRVPGSPVDDGFVPTLDLYPIATDRPVGAVLVCPGGGYGGRAPHEGEAVARRWNEMGLHAFVVQYRVAPHRHPAPWLDASRALRTIRACAGEWGVDAAHVAVCGFSAGGHVAASLGVHFDGGDPQAADPVGRISCRPDALILCYPVITSGEYAHRGSFQNLLGPEPPAALLQKMSLELQVTAQTPPAFLWHTGDDPGVPVENSLLFAQALRRCGVPFELHVYQNGRHGLGLAPEDAHVATWIDLCGQWLRARGWLGPATLVPDEGRI
jgi:acetyl esterase/lipase